MPRTMRSPSSLMMLMLAAAVIRLGVPVLTPLLKRARTGVSVLCLQTTSTVTFQRLGAVRAAFTEGEPGEAGPLMGGGKIFVSLTLSFSQSPLGSAFAAASAAR
jgi:hypothetical protein